MAEKVKIMQKNWIGKSNGAEINFEINKSNDNLKIFTTRPDTIYGATFIAISINHRIVKACFLMMSFKYLKKNF